MKQAIIQDGKVANIIEAAGDTAFGLHLELGQFAYDCGQYPVAIGDDFADGMFSRGGEALTAIPTAEQRVEELTGLVDALMIEVLTNEGAIVNG